MKVKCGKVKFFLEYKCCCRINFRKSELMKSLI